MLTTYVQAFNMGDMENTERPTYSYTVTLRKYSKRSLTLDKIRDQMSVLIAKLLSPGRVAKGWAANASEPVIEAIEDTTGPKRARGNVPTTYVNRVVLHIECTPNTPRATISDEFKNLVSILVAASNSFPSWDVELVNDEEWADPSSDAIRESGGDDFVGYAPVLLPANAKDYFRHMFDRDAQVAVALSALEAAIDSDWRNRFHTVLYGPPACGKTDLLATIRTMLGDDAVMVIDCTATTQAGLTKDLNEREELPRVIIAEEIEKAEEPALRVLLGLLDTRGEIRKVTAREKITRECKVLMFATVNDMDKFRSLLAGALSSRFAHKVFCPRPGRALLERILTREVERVNGNKFWIAITLDYMELIKSSDPRTAIALCLSGRDKWLDGSYWTMLEELRQLEIEEEKGWQ